MCQRHLFTFLPNVIMSVLVFIILFGPCMPCLAGFLRERPCCSAARHRVDRHPFAVANVQLANMRRNTATSFASQSVTSMTQKGSKNLQRFDEKVFAAKPLESTSLHASLSKRVGTLKEKKSEYPLAFLFCACALRRWSRFSSGQQAKQEWNGAAWHICRDMQWPFPWRCT